MSKGSSALPGSRSTFKNEAEFPNGKQPVLWEQPSKHKLGCQFVVLNPKECTTFNHMVDSPVNAKKFKIAGKWWRIHGVCPYAFHVPPYKVGIPILLECLPYAGKGVL